MLSQCEGYEVVTILCDAYHYLIILNPDLSTLNSKIDLEFINNRNSNFSINKIILVIFEVFFVG